MIASVYRTSSAAKNTQIKIWSCRIIVLEIKVAFFITKGTTYKLYRELCVIGFYKRTQKKGWVMGVRQHLPQCSVRFLVAEVGRRAKADILITYVFRLIGTHHDANGTAVVVGTEK